MIKKFVTWAFVFAIVLIAGITVFTEYMALPDEIILTKGLESKIESRLPVYAEMENAPVMTVNSKPVYGNIRINLNESANIKVDEPTVIKGNLKLFGISIKNISMKVEDEKYVVPSGMAVGIRIDTDGVLVLGTGKVLNNAGEYEEPSRNVLKSGDRIMSVNNVPIHNKEELASAVKSNKTVDMEVMRNNTKLKINLNTVQCADESKIGVWVRDSTQGIGTVTFYNPQTNRFAALGHPITDVDTRQLMPIKDGYIASAKIGDVTMGEKGTPGELSGDADYSNILGRVDKNTERGIYGTIESNGKKYFNSNKMRLANSTEVQTGEAYILSTINGAEVKKYSINIESINKYSKDSTKNMTIEITDKELLKKTGGIVQGMSGSPIIQNGCLVGAVTHVFVNNPKKGYAVFAENMRE